MHWWSQQNAGLIFSIAGGAVGVLGGVFGFVVGTFGRRGKFKRFAFTLVALGLITGAGLLTLGLVALAVGQPFYVYFYLLLIGVILLGVLGGNLPMTIRVYRMAEQRKFEAEEFRRSQD